MNQYRIQFEPMQPLKILYEDKFITITQAYITIKKYYFPLGTSKTIFFNQMKKISIEDATQVNHTWGVSTHCLNNWFHYDPQRKNRPRFISIEVKGARVKPSVTPLEVDKAFDALRQHFMEIQRKSVMFESNRDQETELAQKQAEEMAKQMECQETQNKLSKPQEIKVEEIQ